MTIWRTVGLSAAELALLDGRCNSAAQAVVDVAKDQLRIHRARGLDEKISAFIADVLGYCRKHLGLGFQTLSVQHCNVCGGNAGFANHERSGKNHRRGDPDPKRPLWMSGVDLADRSKTGAQRAAHLGCCDACWSQAKPHLLEELQDVRAELPSELTGHWRWFARSRAVKCTACGWQGHPYECRFSYDFRELGCPACPAINESFKKIIVPNDGEPMLVVDVRRVRAALLEAFGNTNDVARRHYMYYEFLARVHDVPLSVMMEHWKSESPHLWNSNREAEQSNAYANDLVLARSELMMLEVTNARKKK